MLFAKNHWKKEWAALEKKEQQYLERQREEHSLAMFKKIGDKVPDKLEDTLKAAFRKAFELVFEKGTGVIEKTYDKERHARNYQVNEYAAQIRKDRKSIKAFSRQAGSGRRKNLLLSGVEGAGLGILGIGIPDIPLFTAVLLKSVYEIALSYGCSYDTEEEQCFILKVIETALLHGEDLRQANTELNQWMERDGAHESVSDREEQTANTANEFDRKEQTANTMDEFDRKEQTARTSDVLAEALLYMKFVQGIPVVGLAGGLADAVYLKKITDYADLKYKRRCYLKLHHF